jgi:hypothetical protein
MEYIIAIILGLVVGYIIRSQSQSKDSSIHEQSIRLKYEKEAQQYRQELFQNIEKEISQQREE